MESLADRLNRVVDAAAIELRAISETVAASKPGPDKWSIKEILGHLIDSAANNHQRFVRAQQTKDFSFPGYDQDKWALWQGYQGRPWLQLVELWVSFNHHVAHVIGQIPASAANITCRIGSDEAVSLGFLVEDYLAHMQHHLKQIQERPLPTMPSVVPMISYEDGIAALEWLRKAFGFRE